MSYYGTGDYYMAGDPGLFSSIGSFLKGGVRTGVGFLTGGVGGAIAASGVLGRPSPQQPRAIASPGPQVGSLVPPTLPMIVRPQGIAVGPQAPMGGMQGVPPRGYHLNKSGYFLKSGEYVAPQSRYVRNRTRNFANGKALNKAIGRTAGFNRLVKRSRKNLRSLAKI